jgi:hypothetical protein
MAPVAHQSGPTRRPLEPVRLARGLTPPSGDVRLARGLTPPRAGSASLEGPSLARGPLTSAHAPARRYEHLMLWHSRAAPSRAWESRPDAVPPTP